MDLIEYRNSEREQERVADLMRLVPDHGQLVLDLGARDAYMSRLLVDRFDRVVALDLEKPVVDHPRIEAAAGDACSLKYRNNEFDTVLCAEVLEHIPPPLLAQVCQEIERVTRHVAVIGVPYRQDLRLGRTICSVCGARNPPWGHVNSFDEVRLRQLFPGMVASSISFVGRTDAVTNVVSARLMDFANHPFGTYEQDEKCVECGASLLPPSSRTWSEKVATKLSLWLDALQRQVTPTRGNWIHVKFEKRSATTHVN